ncbi:unnamed protein product [Amoebophrya sp. A120]|nr:unnamed protein product [Amoebophrya sp. A120]|eukprot:GSA120T00021339001.1
MVGKVTKVRVEVVPWTRVSWEWQRKYDGGSGETMRVRREQWHIGKGKEDTICPFMKDLQLATMGPALSETDQEFQHFLANLTDDFVFGKSAQHCEFCSQFVGGGKSVLKRHEQGCFHNPNRDTESDRCVHCGEVFVVNPTSQTMWKKSRLQHLGCCSKNPDQAQDLERSRKKQKTGPRVRFDTGFANDIDWDTRNGDRNGLDEPFFHLNEAL